MVQVTRRVSQVLLKCKSHNGKTPFQYAFENQDIAVPTIVADACGLGHGRNEENSKQLQSQSQSHTIVQYLNRHRFPKKRISHIQLLLEHDSVYCWNTVNMKNENADVNSGLQQETVGQSHPVIGIKTEDYTACSVNPTTALFIRIKV